MMNRTTLRRNSLINTYFTTIILSIYFDAVANALTPTVGTAKPVDKTSDLNCNLLIWIPFGDERHGGTSYY